MLKSLVVADQIVLYVADPLLEGTNDTLHSPNRKNDVLVETLNVPGDELHRSKFAIDESVVAGPLCTTKGGKSIPQSIEQIVSFEQLLLVLFLQTVKSLAILASKSFELQNS